MPASMRRIEETKTMLFPAMVQLMTEVESDISIWSEKMDEEAIG